MTQKEALGDAWQDIDGRVFTNEEEGDSVADVLTYVKYDPKALVSKFRAIAERAVEAGRITPRQRRDALEAYRDGLNGYTYYEL